MFGEPAEDLPAGVFIEDRVEELIRAIDDVDHQLFHFLIIEAGETIAGIRGLTAAAAAAEVDGQGADWTLVMLRS